MSLVATPTDVVASAEKLDASTLTLNTSSVSTKQQQQQQQAVTTPTPPKTPSNELNLSKFLILSNPNLMTSSSFNNVCVSRSSSTYSTQSQPIDIDLGSQLDPLASSGRLLKEDLSHLLTPDASPDTGLESMFSFQSKCLCFCPTDFCRQVFFLIKSFVYFFLLFFS